MTRSHVSSSTPVFGQTFLIMITITPQLHRINDKMSCSRKWNTARSCCETKLSSLEWRHQKRNTWLQKTPRKQLAFLFPILINLTKIFLKGKAEYIELQKYATNFQTKFSTSWDGGDSLLILPLSLAKKRLSWRLYSGFIRCLIVLFSASSFRWIIMQSPFLSPSSAVFSIFPFSLLVSGQRLLCLSWIFITVWLIHGNFQIFY